MRAPSSRAPVDRIRSVTKAKEGSSKIQTDLTRDRGWEPVIAAGFRDGSLVSIDDTWPAMRFR